MNATQQILAKLMSPMRKPVTHDEGALRVRIARGDHAANLKNNEDFQSLTQEIEDFYLNAWRSSTADAEILREKCHVAVKVIDDMRNLLISRVRDGEVARETLKKAISPSK